MKKTISDKISKYLNINQISRKNLSAKLKCERRFLYRLEKGKCIPNIANSTVVLNCFNFSYEEKKHYGFLHDVKVNLDMKDFAAKVLDYVVDNIYFDDRIKINVIITVLEKI